MAETNVTRKITRDDIESKLRQISDGVEQTTGEARPKLIGAGVGASLALAVIGFFMGRRRGRRRSTVVEIKRV